MTSSLRKLIPILFLLAAFAWAQETPPQGGPQEEPLPEEAQQQQWTTAFQAAEEVFKSENQTDSIALYQDLIAKITEQRMKHPLNDPEKLLLFRSLDHLGLAFYNDGQKDQAGQVFLKLVELNPNYSLDETTVSSKIIDFYGQIKNQNLGTLSITTDPKGATVTLDGQMLGTTDLMTVYSLKGEHEIEISKPGFVAQKQTVSIVPQRNVKINLKLERSSSVGYFITYPKGVELTMAGKSLGVSTGEPNQRATDAAVQRNLPPADFSSEFPISDLLPGSYEIEFKKPCWELQTRRITIEKNDDYYFEPIVLEPSLSYLNITADDDKANIFVDDQYLGIAPKQKLQVCSGKHVLKLKGPRGKYERKIEVKKNQVMDIAAKLNPSITFLGLLSAPEVRKPDMDKLSAEIVTRLSDLQNLNFVDGAGSLDAGMQEGLAKLVEAIDTNRPDKDRSTQIQAICTKVESDLLLIGYVKRESILRNVKFYLLSNWSSMADIRLIQVFDDSQWKSFKAELEYEEPLFQKRMGVHLIDTEITQGPVISQVLLKTFADAQPLSAGDTITAVNTTPVKTGADVQKAIVALQGQENITVAVNRGGSSMTVPVKLVNSPMEIQFNNPSLLFNRQLVAFKKAITLSTNPLEKNVAMLNIGLCHMHFAEYSVAFEQLRQVQLSRNIGIGPGTVAYRIAQCYRELGYTQEATDSLTEAGKYSQNTIFSDDGPSLSREIQRARLALQ
jgi:tetratricopeptide (TPR) repeat protein